MKPGVSAASTAVFPIRCNERRSARSSAASPVCARTDDLDQLHPRRRIEEVKSDDALGIAHAGSELADGERRRIRGEQRLRRKRCAERGEDVALEIEPFGHGLDCDRGVARARDRVEPRDALRDPGVAAALTSRSKSGGGALARVRPAARRSRRRNRRGRPRRRCRLPWFRRRRRGYVPSARRFRARRRKRFAIGWVGMEKPQWRLRASRYVVDSPYMRLRMDEVELPDGTIVPNYYVRESRGYCVVVALTERRRVVLVRQYRYGSDAIHLELPAGMIDEGEEPHECALRELAEETGYEAERFEKVGRVPSRAGSLERARLRLYCLGRPQDSRVESRPDGAPDRRARTARPFRRMLADGRSTRAARSPRATSRSTSCERSETSRPAIR